MAVPNKVLPNKKAAKTKPTKSAEEKKERVTLANARAYKCICCGISTLKPQESFYTSKASPLYIQNDNYIPFCRSCLRDLFNTYYKKYGDVDIAFMLVCQIMDLPFIPHLAQSALDSKPGTFPIGDYISRLAVSNQLDMTYGDGYIKSLSDGTSDKAAKRERLEKKWDKDSLQNKSYVLKIVSYDPFIEESYSSEDRRFLFNTMAGYCPDDTAASDSHRLQSMLNIVTLQLQAHKVGELIAEQLSCNPPDAKLIDMYQKTQSGLYSSINSMAKENGVSMSGSNEKPTNTLTERMKKLQEEKFESIEFNMYSVEESAALQEIADISMKSVLRELQFEDRDFSEIISEQRELIDRLYKENSEQAEELRLLKNKEIVFAREEAAIKKKSGES